MTKWLSWRGSFVIPVIFLVAIVSFVGDRLYRRLDPESADYTMRTGGREVTPVIGVHDLTLRSLRSECSEPVSERRHPDFRDAVIMSPRPDQLIQERWDFPVSYSIAEAGDGAESRTHYWLSVATLTSGGRLDLHWPKVLLKSGRGVARVFDGGQNPLPEPQPMCLLIFRVTDSRSDAFAEWLAAGPPYRGLPPDSAEIVEAVPIYFG